MWHCPLSLGAEREMEIIMPKAEWGVKRTCSSCGVRFYDLTRDPIICPKCDTVFDVSVPVKSKRAKPAAKSTAKAAVKAVVKDEDLIDDGDDIDADIADDDDVDVTLDDDDDIDVEDDDDDDNDDVVVVKVKADQDDSETTIEDDVLLDDTDDDADDDDEDDPNGDSDDPKSR